MGLPSMRSPMHMNSGSSARVASCLAASARRSSSVYGRSGMWFSFVGVGRAGMRSGGARSAGQGGQSGGLALAQGRTAARGGSAVRALAVHVGQGAAFNGGLDLCVGRVAEEVVAVAVPLVGDVADRVALLGRLDAVGGVRPGHGGSPVCVGGGTGSSG